MDNEVRLPRRKYFDGNTLSDSYLNETEKEIIREISESGGNISAYVISKHVPFSYPGVFRYCKKLVDRGILVSEVGEGEKKSKTNLYRLTLYGFCVYFLEFVDSQLISFIHPCPRNEIHKNLNKKMESELFLWVTKIIEVIRLNQTQDNLFPPFLSFIRGNEKKIDEDFVSGIIYLSIINSACYSVARNYLSSSDSLPTNENVREKLYDDIGDLVFDDSINGDKPLTKCYISAVEGLLSVPTLNNELLTMLHSQYKWCNSIINRLNQLLSEKGAFSIEP